MNEKWRPSWRPATEAGRFWEKVNIPDGEDACWAWLGSRNQYGYGLFRYRGRTRAASRVALLLEGLDVPDGMHVCHRCDNPPCVRPDHLFLGTDRDNHNDAVAKGRKASWARAVPEVPLSMDASELRTWMTARGYSVRRLADALGVWAPSVQGWRDGSRNLPGKRGDGRLLELALRGLDCEDEASDASE